MTRLASSRATARGFTLIELMVALVLGLIVTGAALAAFITNRQTYAATESLGRIQENTRTAFELMSRDVREAAGNACERDLPVVNVLNVSASPPWWANFNGAVQGYDDLAAFPDAAFGTAKSTRVSGTDAIELKSAVSTNVTVEDHQPASAQFKVSTKNHGLNDGDVVMVCDFDHAAVFQVTNAQPGINETVVHNTGKSTPGNKTECLALSGACAGGSVKTYAYGCKGGEFSGGGCAGPKWPATLAKMRMTRWYIGNNGRPSGRSLYMSSLVNNAGALSVQNDEIAEGVQDMQLTYLVDGAKEYQAASAITAADWASEKVKAVRIVLTVDDENNVATDGGKITRELEHVVTIRNRAQ